MKRAFAFGAGFATVLFIVPLVIVEIINWSLTRDEPA